MAGPPEVNAQWLVAFQFPVPPIQYNFVAKEEVKQTRANIKKKRRIRIFVTYVKFTNIAEIVETRPLMKNEVNYVLVNSGLQKYNLVYKS